MVIGGTNFTEQVFYDHNTKRKHHRGRLFSAWSPWRLIHDELTIDNSPWVTPTLLNGWTDAGSIYPIRYTKRAGIVSIQGSVVNGTATSGTNILQLPVAFRPYSTMVFVCDCIGAGHQPGYIAVYNDGTIQIDSVPAATATIFLSMTFAAGN